MDHPAPIGVFDSGIGGLTVLRALRELLPGESLLYLGDTARVPYGTKSAESVVRYAIQAVDLLLARGVKMVVVACNTASAMALDALISHCAPVPVVGVIEPGADAACRISASGRIAVMATEGTVRRGAYQEAIVRRRPDAVVSAAACSVLVALAEEGWFHGAQAESILGRYLAPLFEVEPRLRPDTLVLGCTHFPVFADALQTLLGREVTLVDSAHTTALQIQAQLGDAAAGPAGGVTRFLVTDGRARFARVAELFLGHPLREADVELVDLA